MEPARRTTDPRQPSEHRTLGDVLYPAPPESAMREEDWVRLVRSVAAGDQRALASIYEGTHRIVFTLTMRITRNPETAEEVTVDVFHDVWRNASRYDPSNGSVVGWIMNQARSRAIDRVRFEQRKKRARPDGEAPSVSAPSAGDPESILRNTEDGRLLVKALDMLTAGERQAIEAAFFSELTHQEAAARLDQPLGTVKSRIRSGLNKLRGILAGVLEGE